MASARSNTGSYLRNGVGPVKHRKVLEIIGFGVVLRRCAYGLFRAAQSVHRLVGSHAGLVLAGHSTTRLCANWLVDIYSCERCGIDAQIVFSTGDTWKQGAVRFLHLCRVGVLRWLWLVEFVAVHAALLCIVHLLSLCGSHRSYACFDSERTGAIIGKKRNVRTRTPLS